MTKFAATQANPHHLSVGAILTDSAGLFALMDEMKDGSFGMMTGTLEDDESLEGCLHRELLEETGATCKITGFAGVTQVAINDHRGAWQKSVVWFFCTITEDSRSAFQWVANPSEIASVDIGRWPIGLLKT